MTRKSKREIERAVEDLGDEEDEGGPYGPAVVYETEQGYTDLNGEPVPTDENGDPLPTPFGTRIVFPDPDRRDGDEVSHDS